MGVAQRGVQAFVAQAMAKQVPFAMETVFSHWVDLGNGQYESKIDQIKQMQAEGYYVILFFVGLTSSQLSIARVNTRVSAGGHDVAINKLTERFPRTQKAISMAAKVADAAILVDNSQEPSKAFSVCRIQMLDQEVYDVRNEPSNAPLAVLKWINVVSPR